MVDKRICEVALEMRDRNVTIRKECLRTAANVNYVRQYRIIMRRTRELKKKKERK